jgi:hypothetical protein
MIDDKDPNKGYVNVDISPSVGVPEERFTEDCIDADTGNTYLA